MQTSTLNPGIAPGDPRVSRLHALLAGVQTRLRLREAAGNLPLAVTLGLLATLVLGIVGRFQPKLSLSKQWPKQEWACWWPPYSWCSLTRCCDRETCFTPLAAPIAPVSR